MSKTIGRGSVFSLNSITVAALNKYGGYDGTVEFVDATDMNSVSDEGILGDLKSGEIPLEGYFDSADAGQQAVETAFFGKTMLPFQITTPNAVAISGTGGITKYHIGDIDRAGIVPFSAAVKPSGAVSINRTLSAGLTGMTVNNSGVIVPAFSQTKYVYDINFLTAITSVIITPTGTGTITITANGLSQTVPSGQAATAIALAVATSITPVTITVQETGKVPVAYYIDMIRA